MTDKHVDVFAVVHSQILCSRPDTTSFYPRSLLTKHEGHGRKLECPR